MGGAERALLNTTRLLPRNRFQCSIGTFKVGPGVRWAEEGQCPIHLFPLSRTYDWNAFRQAVRIGQMIRQRNVSIVHTFFETSDLFGGLVARLSGCPVVISSRRDMGIQRSRGHWPAYRLFRPLFDQVQTVSQQVADFMIRHDGLDPARVVTVYSGIDLARVDATPADGVAISAPGALPEAPIIVTVANVRRVKGLDVLLEVAAKLAPRHPSAKFLVVGEILDQSYFNELQRTAAELGIRDRVVFTGKCSNVFGLLKSADVFCLPSRSEGFSNALLEAMACSLPCVATDVGGNREAVVDGLTGYLTPSEDADVLADRIHQILLDRSLAASLGRAARKRVQEQFTTDAMVGRLTALYEALLPAHA
jgi:glycosyltransferase involved in cell wall biosynthesis